MKTSILNLIGNTPLLRLRDKNFVCPVYAKLEMFNPGGSIKDRSAAYMIEQAERKGLLKAGSIIVEASSGNQGIALAMIGAALGYRVIIAVSKKVSQQKIRTLKAYGARVIICPNVARHDDPKGNYIRAKNLAKKLKAYFPDQYDNPLNPRAHYISTGPEIWRQTRGRITHLFAAAGTMGTIIGTAKFLKKKNPQVKIIAVDAANSAFSNPRPKAYKAEGLGIDSVPDFYDESAINHVVAITDNQAFASCRKLAKEQGLLVGGSSGAVYAALQKYSGKLTKNDFAVAVFADSGKPYLEKIF